jgi:phosphatidylserine/phosphatidylglycerophosphate/cardiolipin synthase-like enzyme
VFPAALTNAPKPFSDEPTGGGGIRMHHKFIVIDFNKASARVYTGSYNFSSQADSKNGENLLLIRDRRVATSFAIEAVRIFDHYHFRVKQQQAQKTKGGELALKKPPRAPGEKPWWDAYYSDARKVHDREMFA